MATPLDSGDAPLSVVRAQLAGVFTNFTWCLSSLVARSRSAKPAGPQVHAQVDGVTGTQVETKRPKPSLGWEGQGAKDRVAYVDYDSIM